MSVFDCHVNRAPIAGRIVKIAYRPGLFLNADLDKASEDNERNSLRSTRRTGSRCRADRRPRRAPHPHQVTEGEAPQAGERIGIIRFGSRVDVYLPEGFRTLAGVGQRAVAGETVLADLAGEGKPAPDFPYGLRDKRLRRGARYAHPPQRRRLAAHTLAEQSMFLVWLSNLKFQPRTRNPCGRNFKFLTRGHPRYIGGAREKSRGQMNDPPVPPSASLEARKPRGIRSVPLRVLIPNLLTLFGLALGLTAIRFSDEGRLDLAVISVVAAAVLDGLDGRVARLLRGTSRFGAELDSLADFVNFGVAPALILYHAVLQQAPSLGWLAALVFATAMSLRLARFNVALDDLSRPEWKKNFFTGVPAPAGAITGMLPLYLVKLGLGDLPGFVPLSVAYVLGVAFLMVSVLPVYAGKTIGTSLTREKVLFVFLAIILFVTLVVNFTFATLTAVTLAYLALIPWSVRRYRALDRAYIEAQNANTSAPFAGKE